MNGPRLLVEAVRDPATSAALDAGQWQRLLSTARRNGLLAYLELALARVDLLERVPEPVRVHLDSARTAAARSAQLARWELDRIHWALRGLDVRPIALKGAGYLIRGLAFAASRSMSDVDLMVPRTRIDEVEERLIDAGWASIKLDRYDQQYYRRWMHEVPPLQAAGRAYAVDLHHTIAPPVSRLRPDARLLFEEAVDGAWLRYGVLSPADAFLHCAVHLFFDSDFDTRFRDLVDLHELARAFAVDPGFWPALVERSSRLGLARPLHHALATLPAVLGTPVPAGARAEARRAARVRATDALMRSALKQVLQPVDPDRSSRRGRLLRGAFYVRSHWLRMPPNLLLPHLARKALRRLGASRPRERAQGA